MLEKCEICRGLFHGFDWSKWTSGTPGERLGLLPAAQEHIRAQENGKDRCVRTVRELSQTFALAVPHEDALRIRDDVAFFEAVQAVLAKRAPGKARRGRNSTMRSDRSSRAPWPRKVWWTFSTRPGSRSPTSGSSLQRGQAPRRCAQ
jgi:hypothetical protein